jgi:hypothetical protein
MFENARNESIDWILTVSFKPDYNSSNIIATQLFSFRGDRIIFYNFLRVQKTM